MKTRTIALLLAPVFSVACEQESHQQHQGDAASSAKFSISQHFDSELKVNPSKLNMPDMENLSEMAAMIDFLGAKFDMTKEETKSMFLLAESLGCKLGGATIGAYAIHTEPKGGHSGEWKMQSLDRMYETISADKGLFKFFEGEGEMYSMEGDSEIQADLFVQLDVMSYAGKWRDDQGMGELIGIQMDDEKNRMIGLWTSCMN